VGSQSELCNIRSLEVFYINSTSTFADTGSINTYPFQNGNSQTLIEWIIEVANLRRFNATTTTTGSTIHHTIHPIILLRTIDCQNIINTNYIIHTTKTGYSQSHISTIANAKLAMMTFHPR
jgi:hypothetical protein